MAAVSTKKSARSKRRWSLGRFLTEFNPTKRSLLILLLILVFGILIIVINEVFVESEAIFIFFQAVGVICMVTPLGLVSIIPDKHMTRNVLILIGLILVGILFKRMHWPGGSAIITFSMISMGSGYFLLAFKNLYSISNNQYLRIVGFMAALFIATMSTGMTFKYMHWPGAGVLLTVSLLPSLIFTLIILLTLPGSGYIQWKKENKRMFTRKLLIPWVFFMLFAAVGLLLPKDISEIMFSKGNGDNPSFRMESYDIEQMDGLEPGQ